MIELLITIGILAIVTIAVMSVLFTSSAQKRAISNESTSIGMARSALDMMSRDLRCAGFNTDSKNATPQPPIAYVDSVQILMNADLTPYPDTSSTQLGLPLAYDPNGSPRPKPLVGTAWTPATRYRTGAELIRWTLDLNNDGVVDASDLAVPDAADANRTLNPDDYELCREVYGDSTGGIKGNNGGTRDRIALIKKPGSGAPPLFRVYLSGDSQPWDWSNGPVPQSRLAEIVRIELNVVAASSQRNYTGRFAETPLTTTVSSIRNAPNFSATTYTVSGVVFNDANKNKVKDVAEVGVSGTQVTLGGYMSQTTNSSGSFSFAAPPGTYVLKQSPPANYGVFVQPDSFLVTVGPSTVRNFADTASAGGWVLMTVYNDVSHNKTMDGSDKGIEGILLSLLGTDDQYVTDANGQANMFVPVGTFKISATLPDSFVFSTTNPVTVTINNGDSKTVMMGMYIFDSGKITGTVYNDANNNGIMDAGESGVTGATVSSTMTDGTYLYAYTDSKGAYSLTLPVNDPPHTVPYTVMCAPPSGFTAGGDMSLTGVYIKLNQTLAAQDFALGKFSLSQFDVNEPIAAMSVADVVEDDWLGSSMIYAHKDLDLSAGSDDGAASQIERWFNRFDQTPTYRNGADVRLSVTQPVLAMASDTLNAGTGGVSRPDLICGMTYLPGSNWSIYLTQDGTGNEGYLPLAKTVSYATADNGDVTAIVTLPSATAGGTPEILVGTRSPSVNNGVIESWTSASHNNPAFTRIQSIPATGAVPGGTLGRVVGMVMGDFITGLAGDELLVGTQTGYYSGQVMIFKKVLGVWTWAWTSTLASDAVTSITAADVDGDGRKDILVGTQTGGTTGRLYWYKNKGGGAPTFDPPVIRTGPGIITALGKGDFSGDGHDDVVVGWRASDTSFGGGLQVWYTDTKTLPTSGTDASNGQITNWVPTLRIANLDYGVYPLDPSSVKLDDIVCAVRKSANKSTLYTLLR